MILDVSDIKKRIIEFRHDLHRIPEIGFLVYKTNSYIRNVLAPLDCDVSEIAKTGILANFDFGKKETLVFRADMDALPIEERTGLDFASEIPGCMHACGHDGHMAGLLGFALLLNEYKKSGKSFNYNALLLFQPAEETIDGALRICGTGIFDKYNVKGIFGLHLWPMLSKGEIASRPGAMMARSTEVTVTFDGLSAHCATPEEGKDALEAACKFVDTIYEFKSMRSSERSIIKFGHMVSGTVRNAISANTKLTGTMRTLNGETWKILVDLMNNTASTISAISGVNINVNIGKSHPPVINDEDLYRELKPTLLKLNYVEMRQPVMIAEDFAFFERQIPGIFFFLGTGSGIPLHSDTYTFDDDVLIESVKLFDAIFKGLSDLDT